MIRVEIAYAEADSQTILELEAEDGITAEDAVRRSGILRKYPALDFDKAKLGIFGKLCKRDAALKSGDRVEIYRPLIADPKEVRKRRAAEGKVMKKGGGDAE